MTGELAQVYVCLREKGTLLPSMLNKILVSANFNSLQNTKFLANLLVAWRKSVVFVPRHDHQ